MMPIQPGERVAFVGQTGSGKTTAIIALLDRLWGVRQIQVQDGKGDSGWKRLAVPHVTRLETVIRYRWPQYPMVIWTPTPRDLKERDPLDAWCQWVYDRHHTIAVVDEVTLICPGTDPTLGLLSILTRGRDLDITTIVGTQRPRRVPLIMFTEAQHIFCFFLQDKKDRERVAEFTHPIMAQEVPDDHGFWYYNVGARKAQYFPSISAFLAA